MSRLLLPLLLAAVTTVASPATAATAAAPSGSPGAATGRTADQVLEDAFDAVADDPDDADWEDRAITGVVTELAGLEDLDALSPDGTVVALVTIVDGEVTTVAELTRIDAANERLLDEQTATTDLDPGVAAVLGRLTDEQLAAVRAGDRSLDARPWVTAVQDLVVAGMDDPGDTSAVGTTAASSTRRTLAVDAPTVPGGTLLGAAVATLLVAALATRRRRAPRAADRVDPASTAEVLAASSRMTSALDADAITRIALRTAVDLAGAADGGWLARGSGGRFRWSTTTDHVFPTDPPDHGGGPIATALRTGRATTGRAADEPSVDSASGGVVAVPVSNGNDVVGAIVVRHDGPVPRAGALAALTALAPVTGAALAAAAAHRGAVDASMVDPLTGLHNRRRLDLDLAAISRTGRFAVAMVDVDHFKRFNDTWGHAAGDLALQLVGRALGSAVRGDDTVYRYGGEEFCVVLPLVGEHDVGPIAERMRAALHTVDVPGTGVGPDSAITASIGVAVRRPGQPVADVLAAADAALYDAKRAGRDRAVVVPAG